MDAVLEKLQSLPTMLSEQPYIFLAGAVSVATVAVWWTFSSRRSKRPRPGPPNTIVVYGIGNSQEEPSVSPYALKLETYLKLAKLPYVLSKETVASKKGKFPWISFNGEEIADSQFCIKFLKERFGVDLNEGLSKEEKAISHAFRVMLDEYHFWSNVRFRTYDPHDKQAKRVVHSSFIRRMLVRRYKQLMDAQGMGRHSDQEIIQIFEENLQKLEDYLGDKLFLMGDEPTDVDCSIFGVVGQAIFYPTEAFERILGRDYVKNKFPKLYQSFMRIKERTYPNFQV